MRGSCLSGVVAGTAVALILALPLRALAQDTGTIENGQSAAPSGALPAEPPQFEAPPATPASVSPRPVVGLRPAVNDPAIQVISSEELHSLVGCLTSALSDLESSVLSLYLDGRSYEEIAGRLDCDTKTVDNALQRVKRKVSAHLESRAVPA